MIWWRARRLGVAAFVSAAALGGLVVAVFASFDRGANTVKPRLYSRFEWPVSAPEAQGLDGRALAEYAARARAGEWGEIHSLLVVRHGVLVEEEYFNGYTAADPHPLYSVTKSMTSLVLGAARDRGALPDLAAPLLSFFSTYPAIANRDARKEAITLDDALTMRAGLDWGEGTYPYGDPRNPATQMSASSDWIKFVLDRPMSDPPGTRFRYSSGVSVVLGGVVRSATGREVRDLARNALFTPLEITDYEWETGARGITNTGWGLHMVPRDMAKVGEFVLDGGWWRGRQIVSEAWVRTSTTRFLTVTGGFGYAYQWWTMPLDPASPPPSGDEITFAWGWGGQFIFVVPALDVVVVSTAGDYQAQYECAVNFIQPMLRDAVVVR